MGGGIDTQAQSEANDPYAAADGAIERIEKRLRRFKRRLRDHRRVRTGKVTATPLYVLANEGESEDEPAGDNPVIVAEQVAKIETLSVGEAVMRMTLADEPVFIFHSAQHGGLNVVFRRRDGSIGWIDPHGSTANR